MHFRFKRFGIYLLVHVLGAFIYANTSLVWAGTGAVAFVLGGAGMIVEIVTFLLTFKDD